MRRVVTAAIVAGALVVPAQAQAQVPPSAKAANRAAVRKFEAVTPSTAMSWRTRCRTATGWKYWHCFTHINGNRGYAGDFNSLVRRRTLRARVTSYIIIR